MLLLQHRRLKGHISWQKPSTPVTTKIQVELYAQSCILLLSIGLVQDPVGNGPAMLINTLDMTQQKTLEIELEQAKRELLRYAL